MLALNRDDGGSANGAELCVHCGQPNPEWLNRITDPTLKPIEEAVETLRYMRNPFYVQAIQVTSENMSSLGRWCDGEIQVTKDEENPKFPRKAPYIKVKATRTFSVRQSMAFVGDWILATDSGFKVYTEENFQRSFTQTVEDDLEPVTDDSDADKILARIRYALVQTRPMTEVDLICEILQEEFVNPPVEIEGDPVLVTTEG